jgi:hypothetical protein
MGYIQAGQLSNWGSIPSGRRDFSLLHSIQTGSEVHEADH